LTADRAYIEKTGLWSLDKDVSTLLFVNNDPKLEGLLRKWGYSETTLAALDAKRSSLDTQKAFDEKYHGAEWIAHTTNENQRLAAELAGIYGTSDEQIEEPSNIADRYYATIRANADPRTKEVDWDRVDEWEQSLSPDELTELRQVLASRRAPFETDKERTYRETTQFLADNGYYDIADNMYQQWAKQSGQAWLLDTLKTRDQFEEYVIKVTAEQIQRQENTTPEKALALATDYVQNAAARKGAWGDLASNYREGYRKWLGSQYPEMAENFYLFDLGGGLAEKAKFLLR